MTNRHSDISVAKTDTDRAQVRQRIADTLQAAATQLQDTGLKEDLARLFREDPHQAALDDHGDRLQIDGKSDRQVAASSGQATTLFGTVTFPRARSRPSGTGPSVVPTEQVLGLTTGGDGRGGRSLGGDHGQPAGTGWGGSVATDLWCGSRNAQSDPPDGRGGAGI